MPPASCAAKAGTPADDCLVCRSRPGGLTQVPPSVLVHAGGGSLVPGSLAERQALLACRRAARAALQQLARCPGHLPTGCTRLPMDEASAALEAAVAAAEVLERSTGPNAGLDSTLTLRTGRVEADAAVMCGRAGDFGGLAACPGILRPVRLALAVLQRSRAGSGSGLDPGGRVLPCLLSGEGGWTLGRELDASKYPCSEEPLVVDRPTYAEALVSGALVTEKRAAQRIRLLDVYARNAKRARLSPAAHPGNAHAEVPASGREPAPSDSPASVPPGGDTIGVCVIDGAGRVACATSSGGIWLKEEGRVGSVRVVGPCRGWPVGVGLLASASPLTAIAHHVEPPAGGRTLCQRLSQGVRTVRPQAHAPGGGLYHRPRGADHSHAAGPRNGRCRLPSGRSPDRGPGPGISPYLPRCSAAFEPPCPGWGLHRDDCQPRRLLSGHWLGPLHRHATGGFRPPGMGSRRRSVAGRSNSGPHIQAPGPSECGPRPHHRRSALPRRAGGRCPPRAKLVRGNKRKEVRPLGGTTAHAECSNHGGRWRERQGHSHIFTNTYGYVGGWAGRQAGRAGAYMCACVRRPMAVPRGVRRLVGTLKGGVGGVPVHGPLCRRAKVTCRPMASGMNAHAHICIYK
ncbi:hypothetical protein H696_01283 [Fonticula alba]|uniref:Asparaginase n=1 Tax=Fonticula alba TaxID=691883 RepID=A0A058ZBU7_FONAL|nr:hypothetical protein H696_01283 [Fonticula alba]KCV71869.1 hypothetical protein H696_01283 [Fonticula alba]|eukprot:XP_009493450.1 hypothetical protein H696_01283 [Fonticula alba]